MIMLPVPEGQRPRLSRPPEPGLQPIVANPQLGGLMSVAWWRLSIIAQRIALTVTCPPAAEETRLVRCLHDRFGAGGWQGHGGAFCESGTIGGVDSPGVMTPAPPGKQRFSGVFPEAAEVQKSLENKGSTRIFECVGKTAGLHLKSFGNNSRAGSSPASASL